MPSRRRCDATVLPLLLSSRCATVLKYALFCERLWKCGVRLYRLCSARPSVIVVPLPDTPARTPLHPTVCQNPGARSRLSRPAGPPRARAGPGGRGVGVRDETEKKSPTDRRPARA